MFPGDCNLYAAHDILICHRAQNYESHKYRAMTHFDEIQCIRSNRYLIVCNTNYKYDQIIVYFSFVFHKYLEKKSFAAIAMP